MSSPETLQDLAVTHRLVSTPDDLKIIATLINERVDNGVYAYEKGREKLIDAHEYITSPVYFEARHGQVRLYGRVRQSGKVWGISIAGTPTAPVINVFARGHEGNPVQSVDFAIYIPKWYEKSHG